MAKGKDPVHSVVKFVERSLSFLDNALIKWSLVVLLVLYALVGVPNFPYQVNAVFQNPIVQFTLLLVIAYIGIKDLGLALALALAFVVSLYVGRTSGGGIMTLPNRVISTGEAAVGQVGNIAGDILSTGQQAVGTVVSGGEQLGADVVNTANYLTGDIMSGGGGAPEGYNSSVNCFATCDSILPSTSPQCQGSDAQGLSCPQQGFQPHSKGYASYN